MRQVLAAVNDEGNPTIKHFWAKYDVKKVIDNVSES